MAEHPIRRITQRRRTTSLSSPQDRVVHARFIPPRLRSELLARPRIYTLFNHILEYPLTLIKAEAGYGKTTAIAAFLAQSDLQFGWYSIGESGVEPLAFLRHLFHVFTLISPTLEPCLMNSLEQVEQQTLPWTLAIDVLANELLDSLESETVLVLDDYDMANSSHIFYMTSRFIEHMPPQLHLVITTRTTPGLPGLARWRASGELLEINRTHLAFTPDEIAAFCAIHTPHSLSPAVLRFLASETEGWPIAVQMLGKRLEGMHSPGVDDVLRRLPEGTERLFDYLAVEVLLRQPRDIQRFLAVTACLRRLDPKVCDALPGIQNSAHILRSLEESSLFVTHEGVYRYHRLFRDFLLRRGGILAEEQRELHRAAATCYRVSGDTEEAMYHALMAGDYEAAAEFLTPVASLFAANGRHQVLAAWLEQLPTHLLETSPELLLALGDASRLTSRYSQALASYMRAEEGFQQRGNAAGQAKALQGQILIYLDTVQPALAEPLLQRALQASRQGSREDRIKLLKLLAENRLNAGFLHSAARLFRCLTQGDPHAIDPRLPVREGHFVQARRSVEAQLRADSAGIGLERAPRSHREPTAMLAWIDAMTGAAERARQYAEQSLEFGQALASPIVECISQARLGHAWFSGMQYDLTRARYYYRESLVIAERIGVARFKVEALLGLTLIAGLEEQVLEAEAYAQEGIAILEAAGDSYLLALLFLALGIAYTLSDRAEAEGRLQQATQQAQLCGDHFCGCAADLWLALYLVRAGRWDDALTSFLRALRTGQDYGYDFLFVSAPLLGSKESSLHAALLVRAQENPAVGKYVAHLLRVLNKAAESIQVRGERYAQPTIAPLAIQTLGTFRVWRAGEEKQRAAWGREKALHLLQFLICHRDHPVHREQILEALWPESTPPQAAIGLRVALNALRSALQSGQRSAENVQFIRRSGEMLQLDLDAGIEIDSDQFVLLLQKARRAEREDVSQAITLYEAALQLYHGDFLVELPYADWAYEEREQRRMQYLITLERLAGFALERGEAGRAIEWANTLLKKDPTWEAAYALLMKCHWRQGNRALAVRVYDRCRKRLSEMLDVEPSPDTTALFEKIVHG
jgi:LuxR family transcriptional regulator, maltose regulon positive regulatory protein